MFNLRDRAIGIGMVATIAAVLAAATVANAGETLKYRIVTHSTGIVTIDAADGVEGHIFGAAKFVGMAFFEDGRIGSVAYLANIDYTKGSGTYSTFQTIKFDDGSVLRFKNTGTGVAEAGKSTFGDGQTQVIGGEGKYKAAAGSGTFKGKRFLAIADGGDSYFDGEVQLN
jgi:hypothetical protein